jgi:uncharacterized membrane protein
METIRSVMEWAAVGVDVLAVAVILLGIVIAILRSGVIRALLRRDSSRVEMRLKQQVGNGLLMGLDLLVAADVIRTVALEPTLLNVATLGLLVLVRVVLTWSLVVELEGRWPWQPRVDGRVGSDNAGTGRASPPRETV